MIAERDVALLHLEEARDSLETAVHFLRTIGHCEAAGEIELALDEITSEIQTLIDEEGSKR